MPPNTHGTSWWKTLPGLLTAAAGFVTALTGLVIGLNQAGILPVRTKSVSTPPPQGVAAQPATPSAGSDVPSTATLLCEARSDTWGQKKCGSTTIVFQPVYSGNDSAIITTNVGDKPIWVKITPICHRANQCGVVWAHIVNPVTTASDGSANENLTINEPGIHAFDWAAYR